MVYQQCAWSIGYGSEAAEKTLCNNPGKQSEFDTSMSWEDVKSCDTLVLLGLVYWWHRRQKTGNEHYPYGPLW